MFIRDTTIHETRPGRSKKIAEGMLRFYFFCRNGFTTMAVTFQRPTAITIGLDHTAAATASAAVSAKKEIL